MGRRYPQVVVLCEDEQQAVFIGRFLKARRLRIREMHIAPIGQGSAEQYVRQHYPERVKKYRRDSHHVFVALVVMIDADAKSVEQRLRELERELVRVAPPGRQADERIAVLVPRRSIETWIRYLQGEEVNEEERYPHLERPGDCREAAGAMARLVERREAPADAPPSLRTALGELWARVLRRD